MRRGGFHFTHLFLGVILLASAISIFAGGSRQSPVKEVFTRPAPSEPSFADSPDTLEEEDKIYLEQADSLFRVDLREDVKIVKGNVRFRQGGMILTCDSAYFYSDKDMADCFGNVRIEQGDTLFIFADKLYYDGVEQLARLKSGPSTRKVRLINRTDTLITDTLDYSLSMRLGWYERGGELHDPTTTLTSVFGEYSAETKDADFFHNVVLINRKDNFTLRSDTLYYNTATGIARIDSRTIIEGENDTIITTGGTYNTNTGFADLTRRSIVMHRDSNENVVTLEGDSIIFDRDTEISRAYRFTAPGKKSGPVVLTDTANKSVLIGGYGFFDNKLRMSMATDYPLMMEYSTQDTIFLRADTIRTFVVQKEEIRDTLGEVVEEAGEFYLAKAYNRARFFRTDLQGVADSITYVGLDSMLHLNRKPVVWSEERQIYGDIIEVHLNDSTADWVRLPQNGWMMEHVDEDFYNQLAAKQMLATLEDGVLKRLEAEGNVMAIMLPQENDSSYNKLVHAESSFLDVYFTDNDFERLKMWPEVDGTVSPIGMVKDEDKLLRGSVWLENIRPERRWYGDRVAWEDHLGEISDELEEYFSSGGGYTPPPPYFLLPTDRTIEPTAQTEQPEPTEQPEQTEPLEQTEESEQMEESETIELAEPPEPSEESDLTEPSEPSEQPEPSEISEQSEFSETTESPETSESYESLEQTEQSVQTEENNNLQNTEQEYD